MNIEEAKEQLNSLIEHFNNGGLDINATDINAIKCILEENKKLHLRDTYANITHNQFQTEKKEKRYYENILNELEKWLEDKIDLLKKEACLYGHLIDKTVSEEINLKIYIYQEVLEKTKELKGEDNED